MKGKIITLAVAFVLGIAAIAFSLRPSATPSGKGSGQNASVKNPAELAEIISGLTSAEEYYEMAQQAALKSSKSSAAAQTSAKNSKDSISVFDDFSHKETDKISISYKIGDKTISQTTYTTELIETQNLVAYFTPKGVYYDIDYSSYKWITEKTTYNYASGDYDKDDVVKTVTADKTDFEGEIYLGENGAFIKYEKYEIVQTTDSYINDEVVEEDEEEDEDEYLSALVQQKMLDAIKKSYGKWINVIYSSDYDSDDLENISKNDEDAVLDAVVRMTCASLSDELVEWVISVTDSNLQSLKNMADVAALAEDKSNEYYKKSGTLYVMTPEGRFDLLTRFGYSPNTNWSGDYSSLSAIDDSSFVLDLYDDEKPAWYLDFDFYDSDYTDSYSTSSEKTMHEELYVTNIGNTVTPNVSSDKTLYDFAGKALKDIYREYYEEIN